MPSFDMILVIVSFLTINIEFSTASSDVCFNRDRAQLLEKKKENDQAAIDATRTLSLTMLALPYPPGQGLLLYQVVLQRVGCLLV